METSHGSLTHIKDELQCSVCMELFVDPRFLPCHHTFCLKCLHDLKMRKGNNRHILCPLCRSNTVLPEAGPNGLAKNNLAHQMVAVLPQIEHDSVAGSALCEEDGEHGTGKTEKAALFCKSCNKAVCGLCAMNRHRDASQHKIIPIARALLQMKKKLNSFLAWGRREKTLRQKKANVIAEKQKELESRVLDIRGTINRTFKAEREKLNNREEELYRILEKLHQAIADELKTKELSIVSGAESISALNIFTEEIAQKEGHGIISLYCELRNAYRTEMDYTDGGEATWWFDRISRFISQTRFDRIQTRDEAAMGYVITPGDWLVEQIRLKTVGDAKPSDICVLSTGEIAISLPDMSSVHAYHKTEQRELLDTPGVVTRMAPLPDGSILRMGQNIEVCGSGAPFPVPHDLVGLNRPVAMATDSKGNIMLLYKDRIDIQDALSSHALHTFPLKDLEDDQPVHIHFNRSKDLMKANEQPLRILVESENSLRLLRLIPATGEADQVVDVVSFPNDYPGCTKRHGTIDTEDNVFIAYVRERDNYVTTLTVVKYGLGLTWEELVVEDLQVVLEEGDRVFLAAVNPSHLVMCTPQKLSHFRKETMKDIIATSA